MTVGVGSLCVKALIQIDVCPMTESEHVVADAVAAGCVQSLLEACRRVVVVEERAIVGRLTVSVKDADDV